MLATTSRMGRPSLRWSDRLGRQLRLPVGPVGRSVGWLMSVINAHPYELAIDALELSSNDNVLELGFGPGVGIKRLEAALSKGRVYGVDHSQAMVDAAIRRNRLAIAEGRVELRRGSFSSLEWGDGVFDKMLLVNVVYFFGTSGKEVMEVHRTLKPGGSVVVYATEASTMSMWPFAGHDTHRKFDRVGLQELLFSGGFRSDNVHVHEAQLPFGVKGLIVVARKETVHECTVRGLYDERVGPILF